MNWKISRLSFCHEFATKLSVKHPRLLESDSEWQWHSREVREVICLVCKELPSLEVVFSEVTLIVLAIVSGLRFGLSKHCKPIDGGFKQAWVPSPGGLGAQVGIITRYLNFISGLHYDVVQVLGGGRERKSEGRGLTSLEAAALDWNDAWCIDETASGCLWISDQSSTLNIACCVESRSLGLRLGNSASLSYRMMYSLGTTVSPAEYSWAHEIKE